VACKEPTTVEELNPSAQQLIHVYCIAWQAHTVRGFVSGTLIKKLGLSVESFRSNEKERTYRVK
jgi:hypothetical protein